MFLQSKQTLPEPTTQCGGAQSCIGDGVSLNAFHQQRVGGDGIIQTSQEFAHTGRMTFLALMNAIEIHQVMTMGSIHPIVCAKQSAGIGKTMHPAFPEHEIHHRRIHTDEGGHDHHNRAEPGQQFKQ